MRTLDVYLHRDLVGHLIQDDSGRLLFDYAPSWLEKPNACPLSRSLPLRSERYTRKECRGFFAGILPEEGNRKLIAKNLGISAQNDFAMLEKIGGECAGAITFTPSGQPLPRENISYRPLSDNDLVAILEQLPRRPLLAGEDGVRLSLAGAQDKLAVHVEKNKISIPLGNAPSTHILKPAIEHFDGLVFNELACMHLASAVGLPVAKTEVDQTHGRDYLLVERYDRSWREGQLMRLHQEDFCQAMAIVPDMKYQNEGGPTLAQCFAVLREVSSVPVLDLQTLLDAVIFNYLIGNHDAHGKNFSLLYHADGSIRLAPLYDLVCTLYYPQLSNRMAMKIGGEYRSDRVTLRHFEKLADEAALGKPLVKKRVSGMAEKLLSGLDKIESTYNKYDEIKALLRQRCEKTLRWFNLTPVTLNDV